jgi:zinc protease
MATAKPLVEKYFGWMTRKPEPMRIKSVEPEPQAERRLIYRSEELAPRVEARFMIPGVGHEDRPVFDVMMEIGKRRLEDNLAKAGISGSVDVNTRVVHTSIFGVPGSINFAIVVPENQVDRAEVILLNTLEELKEGGPTSTELAVAQKRIKAHWERTTLDASRLNFAIGHFQIMDEWGTLETYINARAAVDESAVQQVASTYFIPENRTIGQVIRP